MSVTMMMSKVLEFGFIYGGVALPLAEPVETDFHLVVVDACIGTSYDNIPHIQEASALLYPDKECFERRIGSDGGERKIDRAHRICARTREGSLRGRARVVHHDVYIREREPRTRRKRIEVQHEPDVIDRIRQEGGKSREIGGVDGIARIGQFLLLLRVLGRRGKRLVCFCYIRLCREYGIIPGRIHVHEKYAEG